MWTDESLDVAPETPPFLHGLWRPGGAPVAPPELFLQPGTPLGPPPDTPAPFTTPFSASPHTTRSFSLVARRRVRIAVEKNRQKGVPPVS